MIRKIVVIDADKCNGCGLCVPSCAEGAITIVNGTAVLAADNLCDGLGACLGECPQDAIRIIEREADGFDEAAVGKHLHTVRPDSAGSKASHAPHHHAAGGGCPGSRVMSFAAEPEESAAAAPGAVQAGELRQWPVQLHLVPANAPFFQNADLLVAADCAPFAYGGFHRDFMAGKALAIGCPKLDDLNAYQQKLTEIFRNSSIKSVTVVRMEVPCCGGIVEVTRKALADSSKDIPFSEVTIGIKGERQLG